MMNNFLGTYNISLDDKGRFNVPAKFRNAWNSLARNWWCV